MFTEGKCEHLHFMFQAVEDKSAGLDATVPASLESDREKIIDMVECNVLWQMDLDRKTTALKELQGHILQNGYSAGDIHGESVTNDIYNQSQCLRLHRYSLRSSHSFIHSEDLYSIPSRGELPIWLQR